MPEDAVTAGPSTSEEVEELLRQLVEARFILTDRDGAVTRWGRPAEELFGWAGGRILGRDLVETLGLPGSLPKHGGRLTAVARHRDGGEVEVALTLIPVGMSQSLEFNGFLEALEFAAPRGNALAQLGRSHRTVVDWISAALQGEARLEDDALAAGTILTFRSLAEPVLPLDEEAVDTDRPLGVEADERLDSLELAGAGVESELADLRAGLAATHLRLEQLEAAGDGGQGELEAELAETRAELQLLGDQVRGSADAAREAQSAVERLAGQAEGASEAAAEAARVRELAANMLGEVESGAACARDAAEQALAAAGTVNAQVAEVEERSRGAAEQAGRVDEQAGRVDEQARRMAEATEVAELRAEEARRAASEAARAAAVAREAAEQAGSEVDRLRRASETRHRAGRHEPAAPTPFPESANGDDPQRPLLERKRDSEPEREPRPGFDDVDAPMATTQLDGHFVELNRGFRDLVGYSEEEFRAAVWPPVMDRANLPKHREQMEQLLDGRIDSAEFDTGYVHAQGLLVPVAGTITLLKEDGAPQGFLLTVGG